MAIQSTYTNNIEKNYTGTDDGGDIRVFITTSNSFDTWRKFTNQVASDLENLMDQVDGINSLGAPADNAGLTGTTTINNVKIGGSLGNEFNDLLINNEAVSDTSAHDKKLVSSRVVAKQKAALTSAINLKANKANAALTNSAQLTHSGNTVFKVKTTGTSTGAEIIIAGGTGSSGFGRIKFQDTADPNAFIYVNKDGGMQIKSQSLNLTTAGAISGNGSGLTTLNASNISSGTISDARIPSTITRDTELTAFTGTGNINTVGVITSGTWQGSAINQAYIGSLPTSKVTSGTFANARISQSSVTQHRNAITSVGTLTGLTINSGNNVTAAKAPTTGNHLTNKTYVDTQVATKDNYDHFGIQAQGGATTDISSNETINFSSGDTAITFTRSGNTIGLDLDLGDLTSTHGTLPNARLPDLTVADFANASVTSSNEAFSNVDDKFMTAKSINDRIGALITANLSGAAIGGSVFVKSITNPTNKGLNIGSADASTGDVTLSLDFTTLDDHAPLSTDDLVFQDASNAVPKKRQLSQIPLQLFKHDDEITLNELRGVNVTSPEINAILLYNGSNWVNDPVNQFNVAYKNTTDRMKLEVFQGTPNSDVANIRGIVKNFRFGHTQTRRAGIHFGRATNSGGTALSNDPGAVVHETGIISSDNNQSVLHLCPGDDGSVSSSYEQDVVWIHGMNDNHGTAANSPSSASSELNDGRKRPHYNNYSGIELTTGGEIRGVREMAFNPGTAYGTTRGTHEEYGIFKGGGLIKLPQQGGTGTAAKGSEIRFQHPANNADGHHWKILTDAHRTSGGDDLLFRINDTGDDDNLGDIGLHLYGNDAYRGSAKLPNTNNSKIDSIGNKAVTTVEWVKNEIADAIAPITKPDILRFNPEGHIEVRTETGWNRSGSDTSNKYWDRNNGMVRIHLDNLDNWAIKGDSSKVPGQNTYANGKYWIEVGLVVSSAPNFNASTNLMYAKILSTSDNPSGTYTLRNNLDVNISKNGATTTANYLLVIFDRMTGRQATYRFRFPSITGGKTQSTYTSKTYQLEDLETFQNYSTL